MPVANVHLGDHPNDIAMRNHAYWQGGAIYDARGGGGGGAPTFPPGPYPGRQNWGHPP